MTHGAPGPRGRVVIARLPCGWASVAGLVCSWRSLPPMCGMMFWHGLETHGALASMLFVLSLLAISLVWSTGQRRTHGPSSS